MPELFDRVVQQIDRIRNLDIRPTGLLVLFDEGREDIELVALFGLGCSPQSFAIS
jgi:hypothetical protein